MKITIESTDKVIHFEVGVAAVPARIWEGHTADGTPVFCFITRIAPSIPEPIPPAIAAEFARSLQETKPPSPIARAIDMRFIL